MAMFRATRACCFVLTLAQALAVGFTSRPAQAETHALVTPMPPPAAAPRTERDLAVRGIYVQYLTALNSKRLQRLIDESVKSGINTLVVDVWKRSPRYEAAIASIREAGLTYVPRVTIFPDGAKSRAEVEDRKRLEQRWGLIDYALSLGAKDVQLDYIRFSSKNADSPENASKILEVIRFFRERVEQRGARLQIDIFGEVAYGPSTRIGQDMQRFAPALDAVCPMLYPSHFEPHEKTAKDPYGTVHGALTALERQMQDNPIPVYAYIEPFNYRHDMTSAQRSVYLEAQIRAVLDSGAQGFYVWSAGNYYDVLFKLLQRRAREQGMSEPVAQTTPSAAPRPGSPRKTAAPRKNEAPRATAAPRKTAAPRTAAAPRTVAAPRTAAAPRMVAAPRTAAAPRAAARRTATRVD